MSLVDYAVETSQTQGTDPYNLDGAVAGFKSLVAAATEELGGPGPWVIHYFAQQKDAEGVIIDEESVIGTLTDGSPDTLTRDTIVASTKTGAAINWGPGTRTIFVGPSSAALRGLIDPANPTGFLARTGARTYASRQLVSASGELAFANPKGIAGDPDLALANGVRRITDQFRPRAQAVPDMTVAIAAGTLARDGAIAEVAAQSTATIAAPSTNPRIDRVVLNPETGAVSVETGAEDPSPAPPAIPAGLLPIAQVALVTATTEITDADIADERPFGAAVSTWSPGDIKETAIPYGATPPPGWLWPDGAAVGRTTYAALFAAIGTTYGVGDGSTTFNLPDYRGRARAGRDDMGGTAANRLTAASKAGVDGTALGAAGGVEEHTLSGAESGTSAHSHDLKTKSETVATGSRSHMDNAGATGTVSTELSTEAAASEPHTNLPPTIVCNMLIKT